jgi:putative SOS response-associated peptidase YedK
VTQPASKSEWVRTFAIITTDANELVADIHDRMPLIVAPGDYIRWLGEEPDRRDLMRPFPADLCACGRSHAGQEARECGDVPVAVELGEQALPTLSR